MQKKQSSQENALGALEASLRLAFIRRQCDVATTNVVIHASTRIHQNSYCFLAQLLVAVIITELLDHCLGQIDGFDVLFTMVLFDHLKHGICDLIWCYTHCFLLTLPYMSRPAKCLSSMGEIIDMILGELDVGHLKELGPTDSFNPLAHTLELAGIGPV